MPRLLFEKTGNAVWISHLDLMRVFQRSFKRCGLQLTHTKGFNPRPSVSIALPLSVGVDSCCELLDFDLDGQEVSCDEILTRLNEVLISGVRVLEVYENGRKLRDLAFLECRLTLEYDNGVPEMAIKEIQALFTQDSLVVSKKAKNGVVEQDIIPMLKSFALKQVDGQTLALTAVVCCQNPTLNPTQLCAAIEKYLPECKPDFCSCSRLELFDKECTIFR